MLKFLRLAKIFRSLVAGTPPEPLPREESFRRRGEKSQLRNSQVFCMIHNTAVELPADACSPEFFCNGQRPDHPGQSCMLESHGAHDPVPLPCHKEVIEMFTDILPRKLAGAEKILNRRNLAAGRAAEAQRAMNVFLHAA